jgi:hypothetical protein
VHTFRATSFVVVVSWFSHCLALSCIVLVAATLLCALHGGAWSHLAHVPISRSVHSVGGCSSFSRFLSEQVRMVAFGIFQFLGVHSGALQGVPGEISVCLSCCRVSQVLGLVACHEFAFSITHRHACLMLAAGEHLLLWCACVLVGLAQSFIVDSSDYPCGVPTCIAQPSAFEQWRSSP